MRSCRWVRTTGAELVVQRLADQRVREREPAGPVDACQEPRGHGAIEHVGHVVARSPVTGASAPAGKLPPMTAATPST